MLKFKSIVFRKLHVKCQSIIECATGTLTHSSFNKLLLSLIHLISPIVPHYFIFYDSFDFISLISDAMQWRLKQAPLYGKS